MIYTVLGSIIYKNNEYCILADQRLNKYYFRLDENNKLYLPPKDEYIEVLKFATKKYNKSFLSLPIGYKIK